MSTDSPSIDPADELQALATRARRDGRRRLVLSCNLIEQICRRVTALEEALAEIRAERDNLHAALVHARRAASGRLPLRLFAD